MTFIEVLGLFVAWSLFGGVLMLLLFSVPKVRQLFFRAMEGWEIQSRHARERELKERETFKPSWKHEVEEREARINRLRILVAQRQLVNSTLWEVVLPGGDSVRHEGVANVRDGALCFARFGYAGDWDNATIRRFYAPGTWKGCMVLNDPVGNAAGTKPHPDLFDDPPHTDPAQWPGGT